MCYPHSTILFLNLWFSGEDGQSINKPCSSLAEAISAFEKKFKEKTINHWANRGSFVKHDGKYQLVEIAEDDDGGEADDAALGKLSEAQIQKGQAVLEQLKAVLESYAFRHTFLYVIIYAMYNAIYRIYWHCV